jgi:hypothetical protein
MRRAFFHSVLAIALCFIALAGIAQNDVIRHDPCDNFLIKKQSDSLKALFAQNGFVVVREASVTMESEYELPVIVPLNQGTWYQVVFIGDINSNLYEVRMYDYDEKQVVYQKKRWGDTEGNIISYSYIPKFSEYHMIKPVQVNNKQKKDLCGYIMLLKKTQ